MARSKINKTKPVFILSDVHGDYHSFAAILIDCGLMDTELNWCGGENILLQIGDILDRGPAPLQIDKLLDILQAQAPRNGGKVIRLIGNHEVELIRKNYFITSLPYFQVEPVRDKLIHQISTGALQASFATHGFLITHAGVSNGLFKAFKQDITKKLTNTNVANYINKVFKEAVLSCNFKHPIFNVTYLRGGGDEYGGIFWEDLSALMAKHNEVPFKQIVGHTRIPEMMISDDKNVIAVDIGMDKVFKGEFKFIKLVSQNKYIIQGVGENA